MSEENKNKPADKDVEKHLNVLSDKIDTFLSGEKPPDVLIIKSHLICEYYINQILILKNLATGKEINRMSFFTKLEKLSDTLKNRGLNMPQKLKALNKLRNKIGHELEYNLSESDIDALGYLNGKEYIFDKYEADNNKNKLLLDILTGVVIGVALILYNLVKEEKNAKD